MDLTALAPAVHRYFQAGLAPSTQKTYQAAMKRFWDFCTTYNISDPFPLTEQTLCFFVSHLAEKGLAPQTGKAYLSALRNAQISLGLPDPREASSMPLLRRIQAGISRTRLQSGTAAPRTRLPITLQTLGRMKQHLSTAADPNKVVIWAIACSAFFGFFRLGELLPASANTSQATSLMWGDVALDNTEVPRMVQFHLRQSKCDQFGAGADVVVGVTGQDICPVAAVVEYLRIRGTRPGPFFVDATGATVVKPWFIQRLRAILGALGIPAHQYAGHSFRIGAATSAAAAGIPDSTIQLLGRWHSAAFLRYIRTPKEHLATISASLAQQGSSQREPQ